MVSRKPEQLQHESSREPKTHAHFLLLALSRAAQTIQHARTAEDFYHAVGREIRSLGGEATLLLMGEDQKFLSISYLSFTSELIDKAEQMTGLSMRDYQVPIVSAGIYERTLQSRTAVYIDSSREMLMEALPKPLRALSNPLLTIFNLRQGVLAPLWVENEVLGLFMVNGAFLTHEDLPAMEAFAGQIAAGLYNVRLMQKLRDELAARHQAEQALQRQFERLLGLMTATLSSTSSIEDVYEAALDSLQHTCSLPRVAILLFDSAGVMRFKAWRGLSDEYRAAVDGHSPWKPGAFNPEPVLVRDVQADPSLKHLHPVLRSEGINALGFVPLVHQGRLLGKFMLYCNEPHDFEQGEIDLAQTIARHVAFAISRQQTQEALAVSELELRTLFASMRDTVLVIDRDGYYRKVAPVSFEPLYLRPEDVLGKNILDFFPPEKSREFHAVMQHVLSTGQTMLIEYGMQLGENLAWFESAVSAIGTDATIWVVRNTAERKKIEAALVRSEQEHRIFFEEMPIGLYRTKINGDIVDINPAMARMFGFASPAEMMHKKAWDYYHDPAINQVFVSQIYKTGSLVSFEAEYTRKDGTTFWAEDYARIVYDKDGNPEFYEGSLIDTTERKRTAEELKKSEELYRLLAERVADVVWVLDVASMRLKYVSPSVKTMLGYTSEEMMGHPINEFIAPDSFERMHEKFPARIKRFMAGDPSVVTRLNQIDQVHKNGSIVSTEISSTFMLSESGQLEAIGVSRDISQRKQAEDDLRRANVSLAMAHRELQQMFEHEQVLARTDGLTKLHNRRYFFELASREFAASLRYKRALTVILFDVDGFKPVNDSYGHAMGDAILTGIASIASALVRDVDILARYGGDEFTILLPQTTAAQAFYIAERLREAVSALQVEESGNSLTVTLSLGIADVDLDLPDVSIEDAIRRADLALYKAKQSGRNHTIVYS